MSDVNIQVSKEVVKPIIEAKIHAAILAELASIQPELMNQLVQSILYQKVDREGKLTSYSDGIPFLQWVINDTIRKATKEAIIEAVGQKQEEIKKAMMKVIMKNKEKIAENFILHVGDAVNSSWRTNIEVKFQEPKN